MQIATTCPFHCHGKVEMANALIQDDGGERVDLACGGDGSVLSISSGGANCVITVPRSWDSPLVRWRPVHLAHADPRWPEQTQAAAYRRQRCRVRHRLSQGGSQRIPPRWPSPIRPSRSSERQLGARRSTHQLLHNALRAPVRPDSIFQNPSSTRSGPSSTLTGFVPRSLAACRAVLLLGGELARWGRHVFIQGNLTSSGTNNNPGCLCELGPRIGRWAACLNAAGGGRACLCMHVGTHRLGDAGIPHYLE